MPTIWITYAWDDNINGDVDFIAQELAGAGLRVKLDHWQIRSGKRLWERIDGFIQDETASHAWLLYATENSLGSESCREEFAYALDQVLSRRGEDFPVIALFAGPVEEISMPAGIRSCLNVSLSDPEWTERITAAVDRRSPSLLRPRLEPFTIEIYQPASGADRRLVIEIRPRAGTWSPFFAAVPLAEKDRLLPRILYGPRGRVQKSAAPQTASEAPSHDDAWWVLFAQAGATPVQSYYIHCNERPSRLAFGVHGGRPQFIVEDLKPYPVRDL